eukprot:241885-Amphidinium_carterae.1
MATMVMIQTLTTKSDKAGEFKYNDGTAGWYMASSTLADHAPAPLLSTSSFCQRKRSWESVLEHPKTQNNQ